MRELPLFLFQLSFLVVLYRGNDLPPRQGLSEYNVGWILHIEAEQKQESLNRVESSVEKISHENVSRVWNLSSLVE